MRRIWTKAVLGATLLAITVAAPVGAQPSGRDFGQHHACVAQSVGFSGTHNPGVHPQGYSNVPERFTMCLPSEGPAGIHTDR